MPTTTNQPLEYCVGPLNSFLLILLHKCLCYHLTLLCHVKEGHLVGALRIFAYLDKKHNARMVFDPTYPVVDMSIILMHDWKDFYGDIKEAIPLNTP
jgi:hypothetical protein